MDQSCDIGKHFVIYVLHYSWKSESCETERETGEICANVIWKPMLCFMGEIDIVLVLVYLHSIYVPL